MGQLNIGNVPPLVKNCKYKTSFRCYSELWYYSVLYMKAEHECVILVKGIIIDYDYLGERIEK